MLVELTSDDDVLDDVKTKDDQNWWSVTVSNYEELRFEALVHLFGVVVQLFVDSGVNLRLKFANPLIFEVLSLRTGLW